MDKRKNRIISIVLASVMMIMPMGAFAETGETNYQEEKVSTTEETSGNITPESKVIQSIQSFPMDTARQTITINSGEKPVFPTTISARFEGDSGYTPINITWDAKTETLGTKAGVFYYKATIPLQYQLAEGVSLPVIEVTVVKAKTSITGLKKTITKKARLTITDKITVTPAYGRKLRLQMKQNGKWVTKKTYTLKNTNSASLNLVYTKDWWKLTSSSWRVVLPESNEGKSYTTAAIKIKTKRYYQNPSRYIQIKDKITLKESGGYNLNIGYMGLKVKKVNNYFHIGNKHWPRYTSQTKSKVKAFQKKKGLNATGIVNKATWMKMGFSESSWYNLSAYVSPIKVNPSSTKKQHIEAMISTAKKYLGSNYVVGASGTPGQGVDCSGLVMQALYAAGVDPSPVSPVRHSKAGYEYESRNLWKNKKLKTVSYTKKQRGDLIFYKGRSGMINHVAIYLGNGKVIESWPNKVVIWPIKNNHHNRIYGVKRVFN